jgi:hypothetical protein
LKVVWRVASPERKRNYVIELKKLSASALDASAFVAPVHLSTDLFGNRLTTSLPVSLGNRHEVMRPFKSALLISLALEHKRFHIGRLIALTFHKEALTKPPPLPKAIVKSHYRLFPLRMGNVVIRLGDDRVGRHSGADKPHALSPQEAPMLRKELSVMVLAQVPG